jgi:small subunit ribosomal protein S16
MLKIRLQRVGRVNNPSFRLVLTDSRNATKSGKYLEVLGHFDYRSAKGIASDTNKSENTDNHLEAEKIQHWISKGAQPTPSVHNLLLAKGIIKGKKINVLPRKSPPKTEEAPAAKGAAAVQTTVAQNASTSAASAASSPEPVSVSVAEPVKA